MMRYTMLLTVFALGLSGTSSSEAADCNTSFHGKRDTRRAYRTSGPSTEVPLLLLTRYRANLDDWDPAFLDELSKSRRVIVFDQSGVASSGGKTPSSIRAMAADAAIFARSMGYEKVDVLGWSMGGFVAQAMTMDHPDLVRRSIWVGTGPAASSQTPGPKDGVFEVASKPNRGDGIASFSDPDRQYLFFSEHPASAELARTSMARIDGRRCSTEPVTSPQTIEAQTAAIKGFWFEPKNGYFQRTDAIKQPVLIIGGDQDAFFDVSAQLVMAQQVKASRLAVLPMAGHAPHHQYPEFVGKLVTDFLN